MLKELVDVAYQNRLINKKGYEAAERIRKWGNRIHATEVAKNKHPPAIGRRNLAARIRDLKLVQSQLARTI